MNYMELIAQRYSVRSFQQRPVETEKIMKILEAARLAPTAANRQPQRILLVSKSDGIEKIKKSTNYDFGAPHFLILCYDREKSWKRTRYDGYEGGPIDMGIVGTHIILAIHDLGLGSTWVGSFDPDIIQKEFRLSESVIPAAIFPFGYPAQDAQPSSHHQERFDAMSFVIDQDEEF